MKNLAFSHIPKTGGLSLFGMLTRKGPGTFFRLAQHPPDIQAELYRVINAIQDEAPEAFTLAGHMGVGIHERIGKEIQYLTFFRDPVARTVSNYYHVRRDGVTLSLQEWIKSEPRYSYNLQTRFLSGFEFECQMNGEWNSDEFSNDSRVMNRVGPQHLEQALQVLKGGVLFGFTERYNEAILLFRKRLGWSYKGLWYIKSNKGYNKPRKLNLNDEELELIREYNEYDISLYNEALKEYRKFFKNAVFSGLNLWLYNCILKVIHSGRALIKR